MLIKQSKNSYIRIYDDGEMAYIANQLTRHDRTYTDSGVAFLQQITRYPKNVEEIVNSLARIYDCEEETLRNDFIEFANDLAHHKFVLVGKSLEELEEQELDFSYELDNPKTLIEDFSQITNENVDNNTQDFLLQHDREHPRLAALQFEVSSRCNERCIHCYIPNEKKNSGFDLTFDRFKYILDQFATMGGIHVTLSGGEALLNKDITRMLRYCREKDMEISLLTNLISLNDEHIKILKEVNVSIIQVSLYSMNPAVHDTITTVKGSWLRTIDAIEKLHSADVPVQISCPVMKANKEGYDEVMKYAQSLKMKSNTDYIMMAQADLDTTNLANRLSIKETEKVIRDILSFDIDYKEQTLNGDPISSIPTEEYSEMPLCGAGINDLCITVNGDVYPCAGWQSYVVGNVFHQPLKEIWCNSPKLAEIRKVRQKDFPKCLTCEARDYCAMCLVRNYNESGGNMFKINQHFCDVAFLNKRLAEEWKAKYQQLNI